MSKALIEFKDRAKAVRAFLASLKSLESTYFKKQSYRRSAALAASRASTFIMMYNCVEFALRESTIELREEIAADGSAFDSLKDHWQFEIFRAHFLERLSQGGTQHVDLLREILLFFPGKVDWKGASKKKLPFSGTVDDDQLRWLVKAMGYRWKAPKGTLGGSDLNLLRKTRNELAHGEESFQAVGGRYTADDLAEKFARIQSVMVSYLSMIERYKAKRLYLR